MRATFDLIVCSHVFEHIADPVQDAANLLSLLRPEGRIYIEVPCELWSSPPTPREPATHINYFSANSLRAALFTAGFGTVECYYAPFHTYRGDRALSVRALAGTSPRALAKIDDADARALLAGNLKTLLKNWMPGRFQR